MKKITLFNRIRYQFDNLMSKGTSAPILLLFATTFIIILALTSALFISGWIPNTGHEILGVKEPTNYNFLDVMWLTILRILDPGVISNDPIDEYYLFIMFITTLCGIVIISILIGIVNSGVMRKLDNLRKGKSLVVEKDHTIILGWSFQVFPVLSELVIANENQKHPSIAILAEKDKVEMEDEIRSKVGDTKQTRIICRTGNPIDLHDLEIINPHQAKSIIIIAPDMKDPDSNVIKTILAITNNPHRKPHPHKYHIVAEIQDPRNVPIAEIAGKDEVQLVVFDYLISRITAQTCRQPGLSVVFTELLDFSGSEIYFQHEQKLVGKTFVEALFAYETSMLIGIRTSDGNIILKPDMDTIIRRGDKLIAISEDDDTIVLSGLSKYGIDPEAIKLPPEYVEPEPESTLILGWNRRAQLIINELDNYVCNGSSITVVFDDIGKQNELINESANLKNLNVKFVQGDTTNRRVLDSLNISSFNHIIVLSQTELTDVQATDARTLSTLLHLRDIADKQGHNFSIVSEMLDDRNRELAEVTHTDDFIVSIKLDSLMLAQISENKELKTVFELIFAAGGPSIYIKPAEYYVSLGHPVNFYTVLESARRQNQIAIGYKLHKSKPRYEDGKKLAHGVFVNPAKSEQIFFSKGDKIIILADE